jgi:hypothetical protein
MLANGLQTILSIDRLPFKERPKQSHPSSIPNRPPVEADTVL